MQLVNLLAETSSSLEGDIGSYSLRIVGVSAVLLIILVIISAQVKNKFPSLKLPLFIMISSVIFGSTAYLFASTIYLNVNSDSGGPVHWHADIEYWACNTELELRDPYQFLSNKIGSPVLHEHDDKRIHLEGVVVDEEQDASLGHFMETIGGALDDTRMVVPVADGSIVENDVDGDSPSTEYITQLESQIKIGEDGGKYLELINGQRCGDNPAEVQVFVFRKTEGEDTYYQTKLADPASYVISDESQVPDGDCVIFEYDVPKAYTTRLCNQYGVRDSVRCAEFGITKESFCSYTDITDYEALSETLGSGDSGTDFPLESVEPDLDQVVDEATENSEEEVL